MPDRDGTPNSGRRGHHGKKENCSEEKGSQQQEARWEKESGKEARNEEGQSAKEAVRFQQNDCARKAPCPTRDFFGQRALVLRVEQAEQTAALAEARDG